MAGSGNPRPILVRDNEFMARVRNENFREPYDRDLYWKTKDGSLILLSEMDERHIRNAIAFFRRKNANEDIYRPLLKELEFRRFLKNEDDPSGDLEP